MIGRIRQWYKPQTSSRNLHEAAEVIAEKERRLAILKMQRQAVQRDLSAALDGLLTFQEGSRGDP